MVEYSSDWNSRTARARKNLKCENCEGRIYKGTKRITYDNRAQGSRWAHHEHLDCQAAWWQADLGNLLRHVGKLPGHIPPPEVAHPAVPGLNITVTSITEATGSAVWTPSMETQQKLLDAPNLEIRAAAISELSIYMSLMIDVANRCVGNQKVSMIVSNALQQIKQELGIEDPKEPVR